MNNTSLHNLIILSEPFNIKPCTNTFKHAYISLGTLPAFTVFVLMGDGTARLRTARTAASSCRAVTHQNKRAQNIIL